MSTRSYGMVGKTYRTQAEAFKEPEYFVAITRCQTDTRRTIVMFKDLFPLMLFIVAMFGAVMLLYPLMR